MLGDSLSMLVGVEKHHFTQRRTGYFGSATLFFSGKNGGFLFGTDDKKHLEKMVSFTGAPVKLACHVLRKAIEGGCGITIQVRFGFKIKLTAKNPRNKNASVLRDTVDGRNPIPNLLGCKTPCK